MKITRSRARPKDVVYGEELPPVAMARYTLTATTLEEQECAELYGRSYRKLFRIAAPTLGRDGGKDAVHDVMLRVCRDWKTLTASQRSEAALVQAVKNRVIDVLRRDRRLTTYDEVLEESGQVPVLDPFDSDNEDDRVRAFRSAINQLPPRRREVYLLVRLQEFTYKEAAQALGIGIDAVKSHLQRGDFLCGAALRKAGWHVSAGAPLKSLPSNSETTND